MSFSNVCVLACCATFDKVRLTRFFSVEVFKAPLGRNVLYLRLYLLRSRLIFYTLISRVAWLSTHGLKKMTCIAGDLRFSFTWWNLLQADNARVFGSRKSFLLAIPKVFLVIKVRFRELMRCGYVGILRTCFDCKPAMRWRVTLLYFSVEQLIRRIMASCLSLRATSSIIASGRSCERTRFTQIKSLLPG